MERSLGRDGFDRFFSLYRVSWGPWTPFEIELGSYYLGNGRPQALGLLAAGVRSPCLPLPVAAQAKRLGLGIHEPFGPSGCDRPGPGAPGLGRGRGLFQALHSLGLALDAGGYRQSAREIWSQLATRPYLEPWAKASARALAAVARENSKGSTVAARRIENCVSGLD